MFAVRHRRIYLCMSSTEYDGVRRRTQKPTNTPSLCLLCGLTRPCVGFCSRGSLNPAACGLAAIQYENKHALKRTAEPIMCRDNACAW